MYIGMPFKWNETIPAFGCFIGKPFRYSSVGIEFELFAFRRKDPPEMEHCHRIVLKFGVFGRRISWYESERRWCFFWHLVTIPAWMDEPTALAHYKDKGQRWHG